MAEEKEVKAEATTEVKVETPETKQEEKKDDIKEKEKLSEKLDGVKKSAVNVDAIKEAKEVSGEEKEALPSFFIDVEEKRRIELDILFDKKTGQILSISKTDLGVNFEEFKQLGHSIEWFDFTQPTYEDIASYRQRSSSFNTKAGKMLIDAVQVRNFFIVWHLKDWSLRDSKGNKVAIEFDKTGGLSSDCIAKVYKIFPTLMDVVMTLFEKDILLA